MGLIGAAMGSFVGAMATRWPGLDLDFAFGRSRCPACGTVLGAGEMLPVWTWLRQGGQCRHCGAAIGWQPLVAELVGSGIALVAALSLPLPQAVVFAVVGWWLLLLALIDAEHGRLPDVLTLPLLVAGLATAASAAVAGLPPPLHSLLGAGLGFALFYATARLYAAWRGREGLGLGDAKLLAALGAWLGVDDLATLVFCSAVLALVVALVSGLRRADDTLAFGPWLAAAGGGLLWWRLLEASG